MGSLSRCFEWILGKRKTSSVRHFKQNHRGRDFVVGDVHGMFSALEQLLAEVKFDPKCDRLFSLGDLIDRGLESHHALKWWDYPWFYPLLGNHEDMLLHRNECSHMWLSNGGHWWLTVDVALRETFDEKVTKLPIAMEIETNDGLVGLVHADIQGDSWRTFYAAVGKNDRSVCQIALWSRKRIDQFLRGTPVTVVKDVDTIYVGHTVVSDCTAVGNIQYIDTGACFVHNVQAKLTLMQIQPDIQKFQRSTHHVDAELFSPAIQ